MDMQRTLDSDIKRSTVQSSRKPMMSRGLGDTHIGFKELITYLNLDAQSLISRSPRPWDTGSKLKFMKGNPSRFYAGMKEKGLLKKRP